MQAAFLFPVAGLITLICASIVWKGVWGKPRLGGNAISLLLAVSIVIQIFGLVGLEPFTGQGLYFRLSSAVAICTVLVQCIYVLGLLRHGVRGLGLFLLPATAVPLLILPLLPEQPAVLIHTRSALEDGHMLISLLAYAILTLAAVHAIMQLLLDRALKRKHVGRIMQALPSLLEIETHMFAQVRWATWLLALGILTGLIWQWDALSQFDFISHKILLVLIAWVVLLALLIMRKKAAWHSKRASIMVLAAYIMLLLAYFGVKLIRSWLA